MHQWCHFRLGGHNCFIMIETCHTCNIWSCFMLRSPTGISKYSMASVSFWTQQQVDINFKNSIMPTADRNVLSRYSCSQPYKPECYLQALCMLNRKVTMVLTYCWTHIVTWLSHKDSLQLMFYTLQFVSFCEFNSLNDPFISHNTKLTVLVSEGN